MNDTFKSVGAGRFCTSRLPSCSILCASLEFRSADIATLPLHEERRQVHGRLYILSDSSRYTAVQHLADKAKLLRKEAKGVQHMVMKDEVRFVILISEMLEQEQCWQWAKRCQLQHRFRFLFVSQHGTQCCAK